MSALYDTDPLTWSLQQADALRRRAFDELDLDNVIEEIETMGRNDLDAVISHLRLIMLHDLKITAWPGSRYLPHWRAEVRSHHAEALAKYTPSMAQRIDVAAIYHRALRAVPETIDGVQPKPVSEVCVWTLDELLRDRR